MAKRTLSGMATMLTGASSGIGLALAERLAQRGAKLVLNARRLDRLTTLAERLQAGGTEVAVCEGDVTDPAVRSRLIETARERWGKLDCLINNAGVGGIGDFEKSNEAKLRRVMEVNFFAPAELTRAALPLLRSGTNPIVVNVASVLGHAAVPKKSEYCASKFALHGWSDSLADELLPSGIDVLLFCPSTTDSEFFDVALGDKRELKWLAKGQSPDAVALVACRSIQRGCAETILTAGGAGLVWIDRLFPRLAHYLIRKNAG